jgi:hypothetical protein
VSEKLVSTFAFKRNMYHYVLDQHYYETIFPRIPEVGLGCTSGIHLTHSA